MLIAGWQKTSLLDYPDKISTIVFTPCCSFACGFCHNPDLVLGRNLMITKEQEFFDFLKKRERIVEAVVISGGEPTLQRDLIAFIKKIKALGFLVKLDTNGYHPEVLEKILTERIVDYVAMDIKAPLLKYDLVVGKSVDTAKISASIKMILAKASDYEFRSTIVLGLHSREDILEMARLITGAKRYFLQKFTSREKLLQEDFKNKKTLESSVLEKVSKECLSFVENCFVR